MNPQQTDDDVLEGIDFFRGVFRVTTECERLTDEHLLHVAIYEPLGTLLSLLDRAASGWWGDHGGDHTAEMLVGRAVSYSICAIKLARSGFYDEAVSLARTVGEMTNLATLFVIDVTAMQDWRSVDDRTRRDKYSPVAVRRAIEALNFPVPVNQTRYSQLSAKAAHLTPNIPTQMYNAERHAKTGGVLQETGLSFCLAEIGYPLSVLGRCAVILCGLEQEHASRIYFAADATSKSLASVMDRVNATFPGTYSTGSI